MNPDAIILKAPCRVAASVYMRRAMAMWLSRYWALITLPIVGCALLWIIDPKWCIVALILVLAALIMAVSLIYFHHAFSPLARWSVMEKTVMLSLQCIDLNFEHPRMQPHTIEWERVARIDFHATATIIHLTGSHINFVMLPPLTPTQSHQLKSFYLNSNPNTHLTLTTRRDVKPPCK